jgi:hypothetical protein
MKRAQLDLIRAVCRLANATWLEVQGLAFVFAEAGIAESQAWAREQLAYAVALVTEQHDGWRQRNRELFGPRELPDELQLSVLFAEARGGGAAQVFSLALASMTQRTQLSLGFDAHTRSLLRAQACVLEGLVLPALRTLQDALELRAAVPADLARSYAELTPAARAHPDQFLGLPCEEARAPERQPEAS